MTNQIQLSGNEYNTLVQMAAAAKAQWIGEKMGLNYTPVNPTLSLIQTDPYDPPSGARIEWE